LSNIYNIVTKTIFIMGLEKVYWCGIFRFRSRD